MPNITPHHCFENMENSDIHKFLENNDRDGLLGVLKQMHLITIDQETAQPIPLNVTNEDLSTLAKILKHFKEDLVVTRETFRCLRNCVILNTEVQNCIIRSPLLEITHKILKSLTDPRDEKIRSISKSSSFDVQQQHICKSDSVEPHIVLGDNQERISELPEENIVTSDNNKDATFKSSDDVEQNIVHSDDNMYRMSESPSDVDSDDILKSEAVAIEQNLVNSSKDRVSRLPADVKERNIIGTEGTGRLIKSTSDVTERSVVASSDINVSICVALPHAIKSPIDVKEQNIIKPDDDTSSSVAIDNNIVQFDDVNKDMSESPVCPEEQNIVRTDVAEICKEDNIVRIEGMSETSKEHTTVNEYVKKESILESLTEIDENKDGIPESLMNVKEQNIDEISSFDAKEQNSGMSKSPIEGQENNSEADDKNRIPDVKDQKNACRKMILLFLTNLCVNNPKAGSTVWNRFSRNLNIYIFPYNTSALIFNILYQNKTIKLPYELLVAILDLIESEDNFEYLTFLLEHLIRNDLLVKSYPDLKVEHRLVILEELKGIVVGENDDVLSEQFLLILVDDFKRKSDCILKTVADYLSRIEPREVSLLADIVAYATSKEHHLRCLQDDRSLLINCVFLLKSIHGVGKEGGNSFTAIHKLSELKTASDTVAQHPAYGFKVSMIRILGNLAWKHRTNQDEIRELECIPLLLDCCNIDARNPLIIQWVVFAMRNLCEKNQENQDFIASLNQRGVVDSATLHELGLTLHGDGDSEIRIAPLDLNK